MFFNFKYHSIVALFVCSIGFVELLKNSVQYQQNLKASFNISSKKTFGSTRNFHEIFLGRCYNFLNKHQNSNFGILTSSYNCNDIYKAFVAAVAEKSPCNIKIDDYQEFLRLVSHTVPKHLSTLWSGTSSVAHQRKYFVFILRRCLTR